MSSSDYLVMAVPTGDRTTGIALLTPPINGARQLIALWATTAPPTVNDIAAAAEAWDVEQRMRHHELP